ncbi:acyl-CoA dehydrogenase family protein [Anaeromyxobacter sp. Fw109-5]|uniref:acyl-CoA dehydrogenase family protein n=1 Tax=Anaeromyxobacter sp. (strain Fw109-5) TaxID=404589 RepID=UPI0000ED8AE2|nr:acyl-CoA dehydrogenase family protein [Anaeromyxobacter sp. Fw109-5]ABS27199.1 acyl-CoA dehydrogenase domain protein [Anaeromyxobacter sp. Fw109-5]
MAFFQDPPRLANAYLSDPLLREHLARALSGTLPEAEPELEHLGELAAGRLFAQQAAERHLEPRLEPFDAWGRRVDRVELTPLWREAAALAARHGLVAAAYERRHGGASRVHQLALVYVLEPSLDVYACPLAMTDGAARTLLDAGNAALVARALPRLTSRDPARMWTSGQWMTERTGGSDVSGTETVARRDGEAWRLHGTKWFSSATTAEMALALARPDGAPAGSRGLALFYLETRDEDGSTNGVLVNRLKEKLGTRKLPTAELTLDGALALPVSGLADGVRAVAPMLTVTRTWNSVVAAAGMQRALALARDYARRRAAFGAPLARKPLHADTLAGLEAEREGAFLLAFRAAALLGRAECGEASDAERLALRAVTPLAKLTTGKQAVAVASEALECFGGAGYVEDTGLPRLLRDAQVLPIWEGTTNVLALDVLRALAGEGTAEALAAEIRRHLGDAREPSLRPAIEAARGALERARAWLAETGGPAREAGARRLALTLGRALELALLISHAQWCLDRGRGPRALAAARRLARHGVDLLAAEEPGPEELALLAGTAADGADS